MYDDYRLVVNKIIPVRTDRPLELYAQKKLHQHDKKGCMCGGFESACTAPRGLRCSPISLPNPARETCVPGLHLAVNIVFRNMLYFFLVSVPRIYREWEKTAT